ncbi:MAG: S10 family peptidase [Caulobacteraceae bacterium]
MAAESHPPQKAPASGAPSALSAASPNHGVIFTPWQVKSEGSVTVESQKIDYTAVIGTIVVHPKGWDDQAWRTHNLYPKEEEEPGEAQSEEQGQEVEKPSPRAEASMFYVAYFKNGVPSADRPITFLDNGGPGSSSVWLHMGAFGPRRVVTQDSTHDPAGPYETVNNDYSLLDASDLVFVDAPGTGFSRVAGKDKEKAFYGMDPDAYAFSRFVIGFLDEYGRWSSPKYLFGESYGTPRSAVLVNDLETGDDIDFNGVVLLSQILDFELSVDGPYYHPGSDEAYVTALPTYAATAWYHDRLPGQKPADLKAFLSEVEAFATGPYATALQAGYALDPATKQLIAEQYSRYTGLPVGYILKANLRVDGGQFEHELMGEEDTTTGRLDTRFAGPSLDPLSERSEYDPQSAAISSAYVSGFNAYVRKDLGYAGDEVYKPEIELFRYWSMEHQPPGARFPSRGAADVLPDLANAMKQDPNLKVMVNGGYFDLATPFFEGWYEDHHLQIPASLDGNIEYHYYPSGHMVYVHIPSLKEMHDNVADFIHRTDNLGG